MYLLPLPSRGEEKDGQSPPATGSAALYWCNEKTEAALRRPIKLYQQLAGCPPQPCSLLLSSYLFSVVPPQPVPHLCAAFTQAHNRPAALVLLQRQPLFPRSLPDTNIYCAALVYSGLISER